MSASPCGRDAPASPCRSSPVATATSPIAGATVAVELDGDDRIRRCAIGLIGLGSTPVRATAAEGAATGRAVAEVPADELGQQAMAGLDEVPSDLQGSASFRTRVGAAMVSRAWTAAIEEARDG